MPNYHGYESTTTHYAAQWGPTYFDDERQVDRGAPTRPSGGLFEWQKKMVDTLGGYDKLEKYRTTFGDEFGREEPVHDRPGRDVDRRRVAGAA